MSALPGEPVFTPGTRKGPLVTPVPREDDSVYVRVEVQFPSGDGVILARTEKVYRDGTWAPLDLRGLALDMLAEANAEAVRHIRGA